MRHVDTLLDEVLRALTLMNQSSVEVLWLSNVPTPLDDIYAKSGPRKGSQFRSENLRVASRP